MTRSGPAGSGAAAPSPILRLLRDAVRAYERGDLAAAACQRNFTQQADQD